MIPRGTYGVTTALLARLTQAALELKEARWKLWPVIKDQMQGEGNSTAYSPGVPGAERRR